MRLLMASSLAIGLAALASSAMAQSKGADQVSNAFANPPAAPVTADLSPAESDANLQANYDHAIVMLKKKMERLTREDGGQLSAAHQTSLQKELDGVNRRFRNAARFAQR